MKIFVVDSFEAIRMKPDSALLKDGKPFFVPDFMGRCTVAAHLAVRICKLGKSIPERFAHRYYDAVTIGLDFVADDYAARLRAIGSPHDIATGFDGSAIIGRWLTADDLALHGLSLADVNHLPFALTVDGTPAGSTTLSDKGLSVDALISHLSRFFTFKTGDIIFCGAASAPTSATIDCLLEGTIGDADVITCRCK